MKNHRLNAILLTGLIAGTLDGVAACLWNYGLSPWIIFRYIASGWFGKAAFNGGIDMVLWGIAFHYLIAFSFCTALFLAYPFFKKTLKYKGAIVLIYALLTWCGTNLIIVPLSRIGWHPMHAGFILTGYGILVFTIGAPVVWLSGRYYRPKTED